MESLLIDENEIINIWWEGSFTYDEILNNSMDHKKYKNHATHIGIYQIYGNHILYGTDVLLYIGITTDQDFKTRLKNRWTIDGSNDINNIKIYIGTIFSNDENIKTSEKEKILKAEALLINILKPAFNSSYINSVHHNKIKSDKNFTIYNFNSYRSLPPELSTLRWWNAKDLNYEIIDSLAKKLKCKIVSNDDLYGFDLATNENIFVGVDYNYWDKEKIPLVIGIYQEAISKKALKERFKNFGEDKTYYYIDACSNLKNLNVENEIEAKIEQIKKILDKA